MEMNPKFVTFLLLMFLFSCSNKSEPTDNFTIIYTYQRYWPPSGIFSTTIEVRDNVGTIETYYKGEQVSCLPESKTLTDKELHSIKTIYQKSDIFDVTSKGKDLRRRDRHYTTITVKDNDQTITHITTVNPSFQGHPYRTLLKIRLEKILTSYRERNIQYLDGRKYKCK